MIKIFKLLFCTLVIVACMFWGVELYRETLVALDNNFFLFPPIFFFCPIVVPACLISSLTIKEEFDKFDKVKFMNSYYKFVYRLYKRLDK